MLYVYNNTRRLINMGGKLPLLPGENKLTKSQANYLRSNFKLDTLVNGANPMLEITDTPKKVEDAKNVSVDVDKALESFVTSTAGIHDMSDGTLPSGDTAPEPTNDISSSIADRIKNS